MTTFSQARRTLVVLAFSAFSIPNLLASQGSDIKAREFKIPASPPAPPIALRVWAERQMGMVTVRDERGAQIQTLVCPLLRDNPQPTQPELAAVREQFISQFVVADLDSDGHPDLAGVREFGAKWARYCVWLYDPKQHLFVKDFLAEQMELLTNLRSLGDGRVSSSHLGPVSPWRAVYRIATGEGSRPERQLIPEYSCVLLSDPHGEDRTALFITRYDKGPPVVQRQSVQPTDMATAFSKCGSGVFH